MFAASCVPIDLCNSFIPFCGNHEICHYDGPGKASCSCAPGYFSDSRGECLPINPCVTDNGGCGDEGVYRCNYVAANQSKCGCTESALRNSAQPFLVCVSREDCENNIGVCHANQMCQSSGNASYSCFCPVGYELQKNGVCAEISKSSSSSSSSTSIGIGIGIGLAVLCGLCLILLFVLRRRKLRDVGIFSSEFEAVEESTKDILMRELSALELDREAIQLQKEIGKGEFGKVMQALATNLPGHDIATTVAVKVMKTGLGPSASNSFLREGVRLQPLDHENVVKLLGVCFSSEPCYIVLEFMRFGDLKCVLRYFRGLELLSAQHLAKWSVDLSKGFEYLQDMRYIHRDIAARNTLINEDLVAKIGDFGMAQRAYNSEYYMQSDSKSGSLVLPIRWMAPESYLDAVWDLKSDVWMFEIFSFSEMPWAGIPEMEVINRIQHREKLKRPQKCPSEIYQLMLDCWKLDSRVRTSSSNIVASLSTFMSTFPGGMLSWPDFMAYENDLALKDSTIVDIFSEETTLAFAELETDASTLKSFSPLGSGQFGAVHRGKWKCGPDRELDVAIKTMLKDDLISDFERDQFIYEAKLLSILHHDNIVRLYAVCFSQSPPSIALEFMRGGDLRSYLLSHERDLAGSLEILIEICAHVCDAMAYLAQRNIVHRDLAARNVLVGDSLDCIKLSDVGLSRVLASSEYYRKKSDMKVPVKWMPPESIADKLYTTKSDVWSFGVLCWEVFSLGKSPYGGLTALEAINAIFVGVRLKQPEICPNPIYEQVLARCWEQQPNKRPEFDELLALLRDETRL